MTHRHSILPIVATLVVAVSTAGGQEPPATVSSWTKLEAAEEMRDYVGKLKKGEFDDAARQFLETQILPQLAAEKNRPTIERVRRRLREVALGEREAEAAALEKANAAAATALVAMARDTQADMLVRVNATLLAGELVGKDGKPWPGAVAPLAAAAADPKLDMGVRVAAIAGLARRGGIGPEAAPKLLAIVSAPAATGDAGNDWLVSRALEILPTTLPAATPAAAGALLAILQDEGRAIDVRVRAAAALGATANAAAKIDVANALAAIRGIAATAIAGDLAAAEDRALARELSGQPAGGMPAAMPGMMPGATSGEFGGMVQPFGGGIGGDAGTAPTDTTPIETLVVRRDAWRLATLGNAVATADGAKGLVTLLPATGKPTATRLATALRDWADALGQTPDAATLKQALGALGKVEQPAAPQAKPAGTTPEEKPAAAPPADDIFSAPAN